MTGRHGLGAFLRAHREATPPAEAGLSAEGLRRTPGLRREELALLAGVSREYYTRLERGVDLNPSAGVLESLARALRLTQDEADHLHRLAGVLARPQRAPVGSERVSPQLERLLAQWTDQPAVVLGRYRDVLAANELASAVNPAYRKGVNLVEHAFLDPSARELYPDWEDVAAGGVAGLRAAARVGDEQLEAVVGRLSVASPEFSALWARQNVLERATGTKRFHHRLVGTLELDHQVFSVVGAEHQNLCVFLLTPAQRDTVELLLIPTSGPAAPSSPDPGHGTPEGVDAVAHHDPPEGPGA